MHLKDYYSILDLAPSATLDEIKKAYRRLALQYHPDKNGNDPYAAAQFTEIKEAYETLTHPARKDHYLQQRWYAQSINQRTTSGVINPVTILKQLLELDKYAGRLDIHRMDNEGLYHYICYILSDENIHKLNSFNEADVNKEIILSALKTGRLLPYRLGKELGIRLQKINSTETATDSIKQYLQQAKQTDYWEKRKIWIVLIVVLILCVSIFLIS